MAFNSASIRRRQATPLRDMLASDSTLSRLAREAGHLAIVERTLRRQMRPLAGIPFHVAVADSQRLTLVTNSPEWAMRLKLCTAQLRDVYGALLPSTEATGARSRPAVRVVTRPESSGILPGPTHQKRTVTPLGSEARKGLAALAERLASDAGATAAESVAEANARMRLCTALARLATVSGSP